MDLVLARPAGAAGGGGLAGAVGAWLLRSALDAPPPSLPPAWPEEAPASGAYSDLRGLLADPAFALGFAAGAGALHCLLVLTRGRRWLLRAVLAFVREAVRGDHGYQAGAIVR